jgi:hypothetical protein
VLYEYNSQQPIDLTGQALLTRLCNVPLSGRWALTNIHTIFIASGGTTCLDKQAPMGQVIAETIQKYPEKLFVRTSRMYGVLRDKPLVPPTQSDLSATWTASFLRP